MKNNPGYNYRYEEKTIQQAILQKTARYISGLQAAELLLKNRFLQELGALQRTLDEFQEDVIFLTLGYMFGFEKLHEDYLQAFWAEESEMSVSTNRYQTPRKKIRAYISRIANNGTAASREIEVASYLARSFSGYVHGASPHIMDMFDPPSKGFKLNGISDPNLVEDHSSDFENYWFRGTIVMVHFARSVEDQKSMNEIMLVHNQLAPHYH
ncbi:MAG: hypothetical protein COB40_02750 [Marinosulfonomonas sp.]|nr:MAG: hypothetical protein COB40_02750 [Marinosulfonomonas sp.]